MRTSIITRLRALATLLLLIAVAHASIGNAEHMVCLTGPARRALAAFELATGLHLRHHGQNGIQALVADDLRSVDRAEFVEGSIGQGGALVRDLEPAIGIVAL